MRIAKNFKSLVTVLFLFAVTIMASGQTLEEAQKAYNAGITANSEGNTEEAIKQFTACIEACEYLVEEEEDEEAETLQYTVEDVLPNLYLNLGTEQLQNENIEAGLANLYKAKETAGWYGKDDVAKKAGDRIAKAHYAEGVNKYKASDLDGAVADLDKAIAADADYSSAYYVKAVILKKKDDDAAFKATALEGIAACKRSNDTKMLSKIEDLAFKHFLKKGNDAKVASKHDEAVSLLNSALEFGENDVTTLLLLAQTYSAQENLDAAIETGNKAVENETNGAEAQAKIFIIIAEAYAKKGDNSAACAAYKKAAVGQYAEHANYQIEHVLKCE
ncbi:MAG: tetratricopeptide repeat protein [Bacteroidales bacterium]|nr:tetratricopeptide repeat protein [Bacteroidales bacterium]MBN2818775.1 tetratricopeptide repeat protein [Bacteroidales bacterium]